MNMAPTIKEAQEEILIILKEFNRVCRKNGINYSLHGGTLLGAIRDGGFIPWDDDADVAIMRDEYKKLAQCFNRDSKDFQLIESYLHMPRIIRRKWTDDMPFAWLDIMIYDPISENKILQKLKIDCILGFQAMCRNKETIKLAEGKQHGGLKMLLFKLAYLTGKLFSYDTKYRWYNSFCEKWFCGSGKLIHRSNDQMRGMKMLVPASCMTKYVDVPYMDTKLMVTADYGEILTISYGADYMIPIHDKGNDDLHFHFKKAFMQHLNLLEN